MCRNTVSMGWRVEVYDCDFNQQLGMQWWNGGLLFLDLARIDNREIMMEITESAATAGSGSSSGGALV